MLVPSLCRAQEEQRSQEQMVKEALAEFARQFAEQEADYYPPPPGMMGNPEAVKRELMQEIELSLTRALQEDADRPSTIYRPLARPEVPKDFSGLSKVSSPKIDTARKFLLMLVFGFLILPLMTGLASWRERKLLDR